MNQRKEYERVLVMGTGSVPHHCVLSLQNYFNKSDISVIETKISGVSALESLCHKDRIDYSTLSKKEIDERLKSITKQTLVVSAVNIYLFKPWFIEKDNVTIINYHNALLPRHRGRNAESWAIYYGDKETGITWHFVDADVDAGKIINQARIQIDDNMTAIYLLKKQNQMAIEAFDGFIGNLLCDQLIGTAQDRCSNSDLHYSKEVPNDGFVDLSWDIIEIYRMLRSMDFGAIKTMGEPKVRYENEVFNISKYKMIVDQAVTSNERTNMVDEDRTLNIMEGNKLLSLKIETVKEKQSL